MAKGVSEKEVLQRVIEGSKVLKCVERYRDIRHRIYGTFNFRHQILLTHALFLIPMNARKNLDGVLSDKVSRIVFYRYRENTLSNWI